MTSLPTIGFIGLGEMGGPMARNLIQAGYAIVGYDLTAERLAADDEIGASTLSGRRCQPLRCNRHKPAELKQLRRRGRKRRSYPLSDPARS